MNVGFIGVGNIGAPIAGQLLKAGHALVVYDLRREAANTLLAAGAEWSDSPAALAAECEVVATCLPGPVEMEQVCLGPGGIVGHLKPGTLYIDHTTNLPALVRRVHEMLAARDVAMLDAPVSGGMEGAQTRDLLVMAGGDPAAFERARPLLDAVAKRVLHTGGVGTGSIAKIMHNSASGDGGMLDRRRQGRDRRGDDRQGLQRSRARAHDEPQSAPTRHLPARRLRPALFA
jgi:3-hydroxyisobutyrate dehydrogenase